MPPNDRISQISSHLNYPRGLLAGQTAIVTGAGQGIGAETARLFANEGAKVIISDIDAEKASTVANAINNNGGKALAVVGDMLDDAYLKTLVEKAAEFGDGKIHIIVNNAGFTWDGVIHKVCLPSSPLPFFHILLSDTRGNTDNRQTMGYHNVPPRQRPLQTNPQRRPLLPRQRPGTQKHHQHLLDIRPPRQRRTSELRSRKSSSHRLDKDDSKRMGSSIWRAMQYYRIRIHCDQTHCCKGRRCICDYTRW
jgi:hypothetical protein